MVKPDKKLKRILLISGITGAVYGGFRYLLPLVIPFLLAYATALWLRPSVRWIGKIIDQKLERRTDGAEKKESGEEKSTQEKSAQEKAAQKKAAKWARESLPALIGGMELVLLVTAACALLFFAGRLLISQVIMFSERFPEWLNGADLWLTGVCRRLSRITGLDEASLAAFAEAMLRSLAETVRKSTMPVLMSNSVPAFRALVGAAVFLVIYFIATVLCIREMETIRKRRSESFFHREFSIIGRRLIAVGNAWVRTQLVIMFITAALCAAGLFLIGNPYSVLFGIGIGVLDALPFLGSGSVLIPWGIVLLVRGETERALILIALFCVCYLVREIAEAHLMGDRVGLSALETLASMYIGIELFGIAGFLLGPVGLLLIEDLLEAYWTE